MTMPHTQQSRKIVHLDLDAYYASVEQRDHPALRGRPVIVGGDPGGRGVVAAASYEARAYGVHSAQPCRRAQQLCPDAIFLRPRFAVYREISMQMLAIYRYRTSLVEPLALDEAFLDLTSATREAETSATQLARVIKEEIFAQTGLTASAGVSFNTFVAKLASAHQKPNGLTVVPPDQADRFLEALSIGKFFGVGNVTEARLKALGMMTGADLKRVSLDQLQTLFGKRGTLLYHFARGEDDRPAFPTARSFAQRGAKAGTSGRSDGVESGN